MQPPGAGAANLLTPEAHLVRLTSHAAFTSMLVVASTIRGVDRHENASSVGAHSDAGIAFADMGRRYPSDSGELSLVHDVQQSVASSFHLHTRLRPLLREIAAHRLSMRFGVDLDREHERARELIGGEAWELVRPERPSPSDRLAPGPPASHLSKVVEELERI